MENSRNLFSTGKNQNTKQNIDNGRLNLTTFPLTSLRTICEPSIHTALIMQSTFNELPRCKQTGYH